MQTALQITALTLLLQSPSQKPVPVATDSHSATQRVKPVRVSGGVISGFKIHDVIPNFPIEAWKLHVNGSVVMHVLIDEKGNVVDVTPISGPDLLRRPYMDAVRQWKYKPYVVNGEPTPVETTVMISLQLGAYTPTP